MAEDLGEKTEQPTSRKRQQAREKGQVAKSQDFGSAWTLLAAVLVVTALGGFVADRMGSVMTRTLTGELGDEPLGAGSLGAEALWVGKQAGIAILPIALVMFIVALIGQLVQVGFLLSSEPIRPKLTKLDPIKGFGRVFGKKNVIKTGVSVLKLSVVIAVSWLVLSGRVGQLAQLPGLGMHAALAVIARVMLELALWLVLVLLLVGVIDLIAQRWQHTEDLKMTKHEVKDERKTMDGDPHVRQRRQQMAMDIAMQRVQADVPRADVVVTNPTHYSVAIRYDGATMAAPRVVASGVDMMAFRIRHVAAAHGVPIVERPPLARALYFGVPVGGEVPAQHYEAVAEVLAYVYRLENREPTGLGEDRDRDQSARASGLRQPGRSAGARVGA